MYIPRKLYEFVGDNHKTFLGVGQTMHLPHGHLNEQHDRIAVMGNDTKLVVGDVVLVISNEKLVMFATEGSRRDSDWAQLILFGDKIYALKTRCYFDLFKILE